MRQFLVTGLVFFVAPHHISRLTPLHQCKRRYTAIRESSDDEGLEYPYDSPKAVVRDCTGTDWQRVLDGITETIHEMTPHLPEGKVADYIPALAKVKPDQFGIAMTDICGNTYKSGDADIPFSIQSISKVFALVMALDREGEALWRRVGREPSGSPFNSIVQLESECGRPRNPFINAGAIAVTNSIVEHCSEQDGIDRNC